VNTGWKEVTILTLMATISSILTARLRQVMSSRVTGGISLERFAFKDFVA